MNFWEQFLVEFSGGVASGVLLAVLGYISRHKIIRTVRRSVKRIELLESEEKMGQKK